MTTRLWAVVLALIVAGSGAVWSFAGEGDSRPEPTNKIDGYTNTPLVPGTSGVCAMEEAGVLPGCLNRILSRPTPFSDPQSQEHNRSAKEVNPTQKLQ